MVAATLLEKWGNSAASTFNVAVAAARSFERFLSDAGQTVEVLPKSIRYRKVPKRLPKPVPEAEVTRVLDSITDPQDLALLEILVGSGIRRAEAGTLRLGNIHLGGALQIIGKGDKERRTFLTQPAMDAVRYWTLKQHTDGDPDKMDPTAMEALFWSTIQKHPDVGLFVGRDKPVLEHTDPGRWVHYRVSQYTDCHPHQFRHFWVTDLLNNEADLMAVMDAAGHESITTTRGYKQVLARTTASLRAKHSREQGRI